MRCALLVVLACGRHDDVAALRDDAIAVAHAQQPALDALVARIAHLKQQLRGNLPGWESALRTAELANDELGLPPFTQEQPPGPAWHPSPASLLGIAPYVERRAPELAAANRRDELEFLLRDERVRYARGIVNVGSHLDEVDRWLAAAPRP